MTLKHSKMPFECFRVWSMGIPVLLLTGCAGPTVVSTPNSCATLIPQSWRAGIAGAQLPADDTVGSWVAFGDAQTGRLDLANGRTRDVMDIQAACEARDKAAVRNFTKGFFERLFG
jgi:hypothetical protein